MKLKYKIALIIVGLLIAGHVYLGYSYSLWIKTYEATEPSTITSGCFTITFEEKSKSISLKNTYPVTDATALSKIKPYQISVSNTCSTTDAGYSITLNTIALASGKTKLDDQYIKIAVGIDSTKPASGTLLNQMEVNTETENIEVSGTLLTSYIINTGYIPKGTSKSFNVYLWLDENATTAVQGQSFEAGISVTTYATTTSSNLAKTIRSTMEEENNGIATYGSIVPDGYRYTGANPNNYITFNNELWRIIGLVNTSDGEEGIKIVRNEALLGNTQMSDTGGNQWENSKVNAYYMNEYYTKMTESAKNQLKKVVWPLGSTPDYSTNGSTLNWKEYENSTNVYAGNASSWEGYIGMISLSDYGYASGGEKEICLTSNLTNISEQEQCITNNWLYTKEPFWVMNASVVNADNYFIINNSGNLEEQASTLLAKDRPSAYLKTDITLAGGNGTIGNPYRLVE